MDENLLKLIAEINQRPGMYLGEPSVSRLRAFLDGYCYAASQLTPEVLPPSLLTAFRDWVTNRYSVRESLGWDQVLCREAGDDKKAFYLFVSEWQAFLDSQASEMQRTKR